MNGKTMTSERQDFQSILWHRPKNQPRKSTILPTILL